MTKTEQEKLLSELNDLRAIYQVYFNHKFEGGFTRRQKRKNFRKVLHLGRRIGVISSRIMSLSITEDTTTPQ
jgi:hypothetical protein